MTLFHYKAAGRAGEVETGELDALDEAAAVERLQASGFIPIRIEPAEPAAKSRGGGCSRAGTSVRNRWVC